MKHLVSIGIGVFSFGGTVLVRLSTCFLLTFLLTQVALAAPTDDFVTTWKTDNPGNSNSTSIKVPLIGGPYDVDWDNDGVFDQFGITDSVTHDFGVAGTYTIRIFGSYGSILFEYSGGDENKILSLDQWGTASWTSMKYAFRGAENLLVPATDTPDFSAVTDMEGMFFEASLANPDTSGWDTSSVTDMSGMFYEARSANPDTSGWDTLSVRDMSYMFSYANRPTRPTPSANPDTSGWDTLSVRDMSYMFWNATSANPDTSGWDTSSVTNMSFMFGSATSANPDTSGWDTSSVTDMAGMFFEASSANPDTSGWDTSSVETMKYMFQNASSFDQDIGSWHVINLKDATDMFDGITLSPANYDRLLTGWDAQVLQSGVTFSGGNSTYCSAEAAAARANMIASDSWVIIDAGQACLRPNPPVAPDLTPESDTGISDSDNITVDNTPDFYAVCLTPGHTVILYTDNPAEITAIGTHLCSTIGIEIATVNNALIAGTHNITYTYSDGYGESGHSPSLAITVNLIFADGFEDAP